MVKPSNVTFHPVFHCNAYACIERIYLNSRVCQQRHNNIQAECCVCYPIIHLLVALFPESHMWTISTFVFREYILSDKCNAPDKLHNNNSSQVHHTKQSLHSQANNTAQLSLPAAKFSNLAKVGKVLTRTWNVNVYFSALFIFV